MNNSGYALQQYSIYFPDGGDVLLDVSAIEGPVEVRCLDIENSTWQDPQQVEPNENLALQIPGDRDWVVLIKDSNDKEMNQITQRKLN